MAKKIISLIFILNALFFFFQSISKGVYPPLLPPFMEFFEIGEDRAGLLVTLVFMGYALARFPSGIMADKIGCTKTVLIGSTAMAFSFMLVGLSPGYYTLALLTFILGVASGVYVTAGYTLAVVIGTRGRAATATALFELFGMLAAILSPLLVTFFILQLNWRFLFVFAGGALLLTSLLFYWKKDLSLAYEKGDPFQVKESKGGYKVNSPRYYYQELKQAVVLVLEDPHIKRFIIWSTLVGGFGALTWTGANSFIPTLLIQDKGYDYEVANRMFTLVPLAGLFTKVGIGWLGDRLETRHVLLGNLAVKSLTVLAIVMAQNHWLLIFLLVLWGSTALNSNTLINSYVLRHMPQDFQATGFGLFSTAYTMIYSCGPLFTGVISVHLSLRAAMAMSTLGAFTAILLLLLYRLFSFTLQKQE